MAHASIAPFERKRLSMITAEIIARALNGRRSGAEWVCCCPAHEDRRPSLAVRDGDNDRVLLHCFAGCDPRDVIQELRACGLWDTGEPASGLKPRRRLAHAVDNRAKAQRLWRRSQP